MSEGGFHVHGPHDHELEHAAAHAGPDSFAGRMAVTTAILATLGAVFSYAGGEAQTEAMLYKNAAAISKTAAADQWSFYQSKSNKQNLAELGAVLTRGEQSRQYTQQALRYQAEKSQIQHKADGLEQEAEAKDKQSEEAVHLHRSWALATTLLQVAIALSAIALLTRRNWLQYGVYGVAAAGTALGLGTLL